MNSDFRDILSIFIAEGVEFLLVGAYALAVHGVARATGDIDLWVRPTRDNAVRAWNALAKFGAPETGLSAADLTTAGLIYQIGVVPHGSTSSRRSTASTLVRLGHHAARSPLMA